MADYIDRQAAIEKLQNNIIYMQTFGVDRAVTLIDEVPSADVVEVVRCYECMWWDTCPSSTIAPTFHRCKRVGRMSMPSDGFCSYGERKDG